MYILIAIDDDYRVRECIAVSDSDLADEIFGQLKGTWSGEKVAMCSRALDSVPMNINIATVDAEAARAI